MQSAFITGLAGHMLVDSERMFLRGARPAGLIVFARNIDTPDQLRRLIADAVSAIGSDDVLVLIDQEGGRVQRLRPPHWRALPPAAQFDRYGARGLDMARQLARLTAADLRDLGINCNCAPVLDLPVPGSHDIIGNRAYGATVHDVVAYGRAVIEGYTAGGVVPVIKHIPGHGRATSDSHLDLPIVATPRVELERTDFAPFKALASAPAAMTAHVVFTAIDAAGPASTSAVAHRDVIRGHIGFDGLLMSDDLSMKALTEPSMRRRCEQVLAAGSDLALHCNGDAAEMEAVAAGSRPLEGAARQRFDRALAVTRGIAPFDVAAAEACRAEMMSAVT
jgi:beta-N-acetylhexosaminidase